MSFVLDRSPSAVRRILNRHWPLPALVAWAAAWATLISLRAWSVPAAAAVLLAACAPLPLGWYASSPWRRLMVLAGFPASALVLGVGNDLPAWGWLLPLAGLLLIYPVQTWRDAPLFPTDAAALGGLADTVRLPAGARVLDAGCGLGHGLQALRAVWPDAAIEGVERSLPLVWGARHRCPWARVRAGDMWAESWAGLDLVYVFQRPDTMPRVWQKARSELGPDGWLASLEFEVPGVAPHAVLRRPGQRPVHVYRMGPAGPADPAQPRRARADKPQRQVIDTLLA